MVVNDFSGGVDGPVMFVAGPPTEGGEDAAIEGPLMRDGDCLFAGDDAPGSRFAVLWPFGTSWDDQSEEVVLSDSTIDSLSVCGTGIGVTYLLSATSGGGGILDIVVGRARAAAHLMTAAYAVT